jgi:GDP/UDP-N,N'-diacetylbacillosamine 2-epimerase (hydrolysing)
MKTICIVTATRAEYGCLKNVIMQIAQDTVLDLHLIVTGTHLSPEFDYTVTEIEKDGINISERIDILLSGNSNASITKSMGIASISFADSFARKKMDMLIVLGDRYELIPICSAAIIEHIPIAHISGGEITEGALDDTIRHCISKMSTLHFVACEAYRKRVIQLGENPSRVFNYGDVGVENVHKMVFLSIEELEQKLNRSLTKPYACVTFHPVTTEDNTARAQVLELLNAIGEITAIDFIITKANADIGGRIINKEIDSFVSSHPHCTAYGSLGSTNYLSLLHHSAMIIGNSSSGIVEAPSIGIPTINVGDRQKGRLQADSIINCEPKKDDIIKSISIALTENFKKKASNTINPYGSGDTAGKIINEIKEYLATDSTNNSKSFYDISFTY